MNWDSLVLIVGPPLRRSQSAGLERTAHVARQFAHVRAEGRLRRHPWPTKQKSPPRQCRAGRSGKNLTLLGIDAVSALASLGLEGFNLVAGIFQRPGHKAANRMRLPAHLLHDLGQCGTVLPLQHGNDPGLLAVLARRAGFRLSGFGGLGSRFGHFLSRGALLALRRRTLGTRGRGFGRFYGWNILRVASPLRRWRTFQIRATAMLRF